MRSFSPATRIGTGVLATVVAAVLTAGPASAVYPSEPAPQAWTPDGPVHAVLHAGNRTYVGGTFRQGGGIAALNSSTGALIWSVATDGDVRALALSENGTRLFAGGGFVTVGGATHRRLVALSSSDGAVVGSWRPAANNTVRDLLVDGSRLYVGGKFTAMRGVRERGLGVLDTGSGQRVNAFSAFVDRHVYGLAKSGSNLIVAGRFTRINNTARSSLAAVRLSDGSLTGWSPARVCSTCNTYWDVAVDARNAYIGSSGPGGWFGAYNLSTGARAWPSVHTDGDVQAVTVADDGLVYIGGHFGQYVGSTSNVRSVLAAINSTTGAVERTFTPKVYSTYPGAWALTSSATTLYAAGNFTGVRVNGRNNHEPYLASFRTGPAVPAPSGNVRGSWNFDETSGTVVHDSSSYGNDGTVHGATLGRPGRQGTSLGFDNNAHVLVSSDASLNPGASNFEFSAYVNFTVLPPSGGTYDIVRKGLAATSGGEYKVEIVQSGRARCIAKDSTGRTGRVPGPMASLADGTWHQVGCRRTGSTWSVVVDGVTRSRSVDFGSIGNNRSLSIGSNYGNEDGLPGRIDDVRMTIG